MDRILDQGIHCDDLKEIIERTPNNPNDFIITYISGYVRRKAIRFSTCQKPRTVKIVWSLTTLKNLTEIKC